MELPNMPINLKITPPLWNTCNKSSTGGVWNSNAAAQVLKTVTAKN